uniref:CHCH domain-containing protein n=1 Tax=Tetradesmus obliquus TaxID=3088 RepID=A0A383VH70_TETOB|eukprot:jgi/Sobl393_1/19103/SZX64283.1
MPPQQNAAGTNSDRYMRAFASSLAACSAQAQAYGKCLSDRLPEVEKGCCQREFQSLKQCFVKEFKARKRG